MQGHNSETGLLPGLWQQSQAQSQVDHTSRGLKLWQGPGEDPGLSMVGGSTGVMLGQGQGHWSQGDNSGVSHDVTGAVADRYVI